MRIGLDLRLHAYAPGGISRYGRALARHLTPLLPAGTLHLVYHRKEQTPLPLTGVRTGRAWTPPHNRFERWALGAELWPRRFELFHSTDFIPPAWGAQRRVITVHDLNFLYYPDYLTADARRYYNDQIQWAVREADGIIADSEATRKDLEARLGVKRERVTVVHLAADPVFRPLSSEATQAVLARYGLERGYVLFVGTWEPRKNLPALVEAVARLRDLGEPRQLVIAGRPGWLYDEIYERIAARRLADQTHFIERVPVEDLAALYNGALLLAMPSFYEGFGLPALEAMQCGTPPVVAGRASLPEVVGDAGLLVDPDDVDTLVSAFRRIATDATLRASLVQTGLERARTFTWRKAAQETLTVYERVLGQRIGLSSQPERGES